MQEMSPGTALRQLQQAQAGLKKARQLLEAGQGRGGRPMTAVFEAGWESLIQAHRLMAEIHAEAADEAVMTKQLAVQRYATALLVRLRRLQRHGGIDRGVLRRGRPVRRRGHRGLNRMARPQVPPRGRRGRGPRSWSPTAA